MKTSISEKARVGVMTVGHREYWEWNQFPGMRENLIQIGKEIADCIAETGVEVFFEFVDNREGSYEAGLRLKEKNIDLLFLHVTTYAASGRWVQGALAAGCPIVVVGSQHWKDTSGIRNIDADEGNSAGGPCGFPEAYHALMRCGKTPAGLIFGIHIDDRFRNDLHEWAKAANAVHAFKGVAFGFMGHTFEGMLDMNFDPTSITRVMGSHVKMVEMCELVDYVEKCTPEEVSAKIDEIKENFELKPRSYERMTADIKDAKIFAMAPAQITGYGTGNALDINLQDKMGGDLHQFYGYAQQFIGVLNQREEIGMAFTSFNLNFPQWEVSVDAVKCQRSGITTNEVLGCLSGYYGGQYVSDFNRFGKVYKVQIMGDPQQRLDERSLDNTYVRLHNGKMAPLSQFVTLRRIYGADKLTRFNMYNSIAVSVMPAEGYSSGDAIRAVQEVAKQTLPQQYAVDFGGITREESQQTSGGTTMIFLICIVLIYLILAALYESFWLPLAIIIAVPVGLMGSFLLTKIAGLENNIYLQTGVIMLIGLLSKTAILITEYAVERRKQGMNIVEAAVEAAGARLRAILMTVLTMIFGMLPLVVATGVGANGNRSLGTGVVGGSVIGTLALLLLVPAFFVVFQKLQEKFQKYKK